MARRMFSMASDSVRPWLTQPGIAGHSATTQPSSPRCSVITKVMIDNAVNAGHPTPHHEARPAERRARSPVLGLAR